MKIYRSGGVWFIRFANKTTAQDLRSWSFQNLPPFIVIILVAIYVYLKTK